MDVWLLRFDCGVEVAVWHLELMDKFSFEIHANEADLDHLAFHLGLVYDELGLWYRGSELSPKRLAPRFRVWRQDDHCNDFIVKDVTSRCEAEALVAEFTARGHKQSYWWDALSA